MFYCRLCEAWLLFAVLMGGEKYWKETNWFQCLQVPIGIQLFLYCQHSELIIISD